MRALAWTLIAGLLLSAPAAAQDLSRPRVSLNAGIAQYDVSGVHDSPIFALRGGVFLSRLLYLEGSFGYAAVDYASLLIPEVQAQLRWPLGRFAPYLGLGGGAVVFVADEPDQGSYADPTFSVAGGLRVILPARVGLRAELRVRAIGSDFGASGTELTAGITYRF